MNPPLMFEITAWMMLAAAIYHADVIMLRAGQWGAEVVVAVFAIAVLVIIGILMVLSALTFGRSADDDRGPPRGF